MFVILGGFEFFDFVLFTLEYVLKAFSKKSSYWVVISGRSMIFWKYFSPLILFSIKLSEMAALVLLPELEELFFLESIFFLKDVCIYIYTNVRYLSFLICPFFFSLSLSFSTHSLSLALSHTPLKDSSFFSFFFFFLFLCL